MRVAAFDRLELRPQQLGLEAQRRDGGVLLLAGAAAIDDEVERVLRVAWGLHEPRPEVLQARGVDPRVVTLSASSRTRIAAGPNSSVSDDATASTHGRRRAKFT